MIRLGGKKMYIIYIEILKAKFLDLRAGTTSQQKLTSYRLPDFFLTNLVAGQIWNDQQKSELLVFDFF